MVVVRKSQHVTKFVRHNIGSLDIIPGAIANSLSYVAVNLDSLAPDPNVIGHVWGSCRSRHAPTVWPDRGATARCCGFEIFKRDYIDDPVIIATVRDTVRSVAVIERPIDLTLDGIESFSEIRYSLGVITKSVAGSNHRVYRQRSAYPGKDLATHGECAS